jgi:hypothetical protein
MGDSQKVKKSKGQKGNANFLAMVERDVPARFFINSLHKRAGTARST